MTSFIIIIIIINLLSFWFFDRVNTEKQKFSDSSTPEPTTSPIPGKLPPLDEPDNDNSNNNNNDINDDNNEASADDVPPAPPEDAEALTEKDAQVESYFFYQLVLFWIVQYSVYSFDEIVLMNFHSRAMTLWEDVSVRPSVQWSLSLLVCR